MERSGWLCGQAALLPCGCWAITWAVPAWQPTRTAACSAARDNCPGVSCDIQRAVCQAGTSSPARLRMRPSSGCITIRRGGTTANWADSFHQTPLFLNLTIPSHTTDINTFTRIPCATLIAADIALMGSVHGYV
jgi:hypothetical protein